MRSVLVGRTFVVAILIGSLAGCASVMNPYVAPEKDYFAGDRSVEPKARSFDAAVRYAEDTREEYYTAIKEHTQFNRAAGLVLIGIAAAAGAVGLTGGSTDVIAMLGVSGAGVFAASNWVFKKPRLATYVAGAKALTCTLSAFGPIRAADSGPLEMHVSVLARRLVTLRGALDAIDPALRAGNTPARRVVDRGEQVLGIGEKTLDDGRELLGTYRTAGVRLYDAVQKIRAEVYTALLASEPDINALVRTLGKSIPANAALITGFDISAAVDPAQALSAADENLQKLLEATAAVEETSEKIQTILVQVGTPPGVSEIEACGIDAKASGLAFRLDPASQVFLDDAGSTAEIVVSGGLGPYGARWIGDRGALPDPTVDHDVGGEGRAIVAIAAGEAAPDTYRLLVFDQRAAGQGTLLVTVRGRSNGGSGSDTGGGGGGGASADIRAIQTRLIALNCLARTRPGSSGTPVSNADGSWGTLSQGALESLLEANGTTVEVFMATVPDGPADPGFVAFVNDQLEGSSGCTVAPSG